MRLSTTLTVAAILFAAPIAASPGDPLEDAPEAARRHAAFAAAQDDIDALVASIMNE